MSSKLDFVEYVCDQAKDAGMITTKRMFGEFGVYCDTLFFGLICDDQFFIKYTKEAHEFDENVELVPPYQGAKPYILISNLDDRDYVSQMIRLTCQSLPIPKPKKPKRNCI